MYLEDIFRNLRNIWVCKEVMAMKKTEMKTIAIKRTAEKVTAIETMKNLLKSSAIGIGFALAIFCAVCISFDITYGGNFTLKNYQFTKMAIGCMIVGLGFGAPTVIYSKEALPIPVRVLIHMGIGCVVYTITAYSVGWMSNKGNPAQSIGMVLLQLLAAFIIWLFFMMHYRREAGKMNEKIQARK